jgi:hypothetical protein
LEIDTQTVSRPNSWVWLYERLGRRPRAAIINGEIQPEDAIAGASPVIDDLIGNQSVTRDWGFNFPAELSVCHAIEPLVDVFPE